MKNKKQKEILLEQLKKTPIIQIACEKLGLGRATYYRWKKEDPEFAKIAEQALTEGFLLVNDLAESQLISAIREKNMTGIMFWLRHHHENYNPKIELKGYIKHTYDELSPEEKELVQEALRLGALMESSEENDKNHDQATNNNRTNN